MTSSASFGDEFLSDVDYLLGLCFMSDILGKKTRVFCVRGESKIFHEVNCVFLTTSKYLTVNINFVSSVASESEAYDNGRSGGRSARVLLQSISIPSFRFMLITCISVIFRCVYYM